MKIKNNEILRKMWDEMYTLLSNLKNNVECNRKKCEEDLKLHPVNLLDNLMAGGGQVDRI